LQDWVEARDPARFRATEIEIHEVNRQYKSGCSTKIEVFRFPSGAS
jgi:hypothetical protein